MTKTYQRLKTNRFVGPLPTGAENSGQVFLQMGTAPRLLVGVGGVLTDIAAIGTGTPVNAVAATLTTAMTGANNDLVFTAKTKGALAPSITLVNPGTANATLAVTVVGRAITVSLATGANSAISSTAALVKAGIEATPAAHALVGIAHANGNNGTGLVTALATAPLTGGVDGTVGNKGTMLQDGNFLYLATAANTINDANWVSIDLLALGSDTSVAIAALQAQTATLPTYLQGVTSGQKMLRNTQNVTGTLTVDLSASFTSIDEVVAVLGVAPSMDANAVYVTIPTQTGADAGKFTIGVTKPTAANDCTPIASTTATAVHYIGFGTPVVPA